MQIRAILTATILTAVFAIPAMAQSTTRGDFYLGDLNNPVVFVDMKKAEYYIPATLYIWNDSDSCRARVVHGTFKDRGGTADVHEMVMIVSGGTTTKLGPYPGSALPIFCQTGGEYTFQGKPYRYLSGLWVKLGDLPPNLLKMDMVSFEKLVTPD